MRAFVLKAVAVVVVPLLVGLMVALGIHSWVAGKPNEYTSRALVSFAPRATATGSLPSAETVAQQAARYVAYLNAPSTSAAAAVAVHGRRDLLQHGLRAVQEPATANVSVEVTSLSAVEATAAANAYAQLALQKAKKDPVVTSDLVAPAIVPGGPSGPARTLVSVAGGVFGLVIALGLGVLAAVGITRVPRSGVVTEARAAFGGRRAAAPADPAAEPGRTPGGQLPATGATA